MIWNLCLAGPARMKHILMLNAMNIILIHSLICVLFYCPLITTDALSLYEYLLVKGSTASFEEISAVLNALMMPLDDFEKSLKKLNEYKLLFTYAYDEDGKYLFSLRNPKTRDEFIHDEILVRDFILKTNGEYYN